MLFRSAGVGSGGDKKAGVQSIKDYMRALAATVPATIDAKYAAEKAAADDAQRRVALQQYIGEIMQPYLSGFTKAAESNAAIYESQGRADLAAGARSSAARTAAAYAAQAQGLPAMNELNNKLSWAAQVQQIGIQQQLQKLYGQAPNQALLDLASQ